MTIDRRTFMSGTAVLAVAPALNLAPVLLPLRKGQASRLVIKIEGWSEPHQSGADEEVWISLDRSWRTAWR